MTSLQLAVAERVHHAPVVPCELPDGIRLVYADDRGRQHAVDLHDANLVDFGLAKPLRKPSAYRGQRNFPGWWWSATTRSHVLYESWLERHYIIEAEGLSHTWGEGRDLSPNEMFTACVGISGYIPLPLTADDYTELLPVAFRTVNDYGITIDNRTYDCKALNPYRRKDSGLPGGNRTKWEVHYDPYDITVIWLRNHEADEWITVPWVYRSLAGQPFGLALWDHARRMTTERPGPRPAEADIARNVADLLNRAHGRDLSREDARAVAVEANRPAHPKPAADEGPDPAVEPDDEAGEDEETAATGPGGYEVFDPDGVAWRL